MVNVNIYSIHGSYGIACFFCFEACIKKPPQLPPSALCIRSVRRGVAVSTRYEWRDPWSARLGGSWDGLKRSPGFVEVLQDKKNAILNSYI